LGEDRGNLKKKNWRGSWGAPHLQNRKVSKKKENHRRPQKTFLKGVHLFGMTSQGRKKIVRGGENETVKQRQKKNPRKVVAPFISH